MASAAGSVNASGMMRNHCLCSGEIVGFAVAERGVVAVVGDAMDGSSEKNSKTH